MLVVGAAWALLPLQRCRGFHEMAVAPWLCRSESPAPTASGRRSARFAGARGFGADTVTGEMGCSGSGSAQRLCCRLLAAAPGVFSDTVQDTGVSAGTRGAGGSGGAGAARRWSRRCAAR